MACTQHERIRELSIQQYTTVSQNLATLSADISVVHYFLFDPLETKLNLNQLSGIRY